MKISLLKVIKAPEAYCTIITTTIILHNQMRIIFIHLGSDYNQLHKLLIIQSMVDLISINQLEEANCQV